MTVTKAFGRTRRDAELNWIPYIAVVGKRELEGNVVAIRRRSDGKQYNSTVRELAQDVAAATKGYPSLQCR